jgi:hypothetical protein
MSKDINIADIVVHLHPESSCDDRDKMEQELRDHDGVISVHFDMDSHPRSLVVAYNPEVVTSEVLLEGIRKCDDQAVMAGI